MSLYTVNCEKCLQPEFCRHLTFTEDAVMCRRCAGIPSKWQRFRLKREIKKLEKLVNRQD